MPDATIQTGDKLQLNFDVENRGTRRGSQTVELLLDDEVVDEAAVVLDSTETGQLVLETDAFSDDDEGEVFVVETVIGTRTEATFEVEVVAISDSVVDNFEDYEQEGVYGPGDDITNFYSGDIDGFTRSTSITLTGSHTLRKEPGAEYITSQPGDGLNRYPEKGDIISLFVRPDGSRPGFHFGLEDEDNWYGMRLRSSDNSFWVRTRVDGELTQVEDSVSISSQTWYEVELLWHDGDGVESEDTIEGKLYSLNINGDVTRDSEIASTQLTESSHANQRGIGFRSTGSEGSNNEAYYDDVRVIGRVGD